MPGTLYKSNISFTKNNLHVNKARITVTNILTKVFPPFFLFTLPVESFESESDKLLELTCEFV